MSGHTMKVIHKWGEVRLQPECHEPDGASCRIECVKGCDEWSFIDHEHELQPVGYCNTVLWISSADCIFEVCAITTEFPLFDGMPIEVSWDEGTYWWKPVNAAVIVGVIAHERQEN